MVIVRIIVFGYQTQLTWVNWGIITSDYFNVLNGLHKGGVLSPKLFAIYIGDLSNTLALC